MPAALSHVFACTKHERGKHGDALILEMDRKPVGLWSRGIDPIGSVLLNALPFATGDQFRVGKSYRVTIEEMP